MTEQTVVSLATRFGEFLPYPIEVRGGGPARVINERPFPWRDAALIGDRERRALLDDGAERFGVPVMDVFPIRAEPGGVEGLAYVLSTAPSPVSRPAHRVYLRGMLLSDQVNNLLPDWAFFVRCMVNTTSLRPTASREQLFDDELFRATRDELGVAVRRHFLELAEKDPERLRRVVNTHDLGLRALAAHDDEFLRIIAPWLPIHTALGPTTLGALVTENTTIHYTTTYEAFQQVSQIAAPLRLPVVNGGFVYAIDLLERLPEVYPGHEVLPLEADDLLDELEPITLEERLSLAPFLTLADGVLQPFRCRSELRRYQPAAMPAFLTLGDVARLRRAYEDSRLVADDLLRRVLDETAVDLGLEAAYGTLCFNYSNPMVRRLAEMPDQRLQADAIGLLYVQSLLLGRQPVSGKEMDMYSRTLLSLLERSLTGARQTAEEQR